MTRDIANSNRRPPARTFLPDSWRLFLCARLIELGGLAFLTAGLVVAIALSSYHPADPSFNVAASTDELAHVHNLLGTPGAHFADLFLQTLGVVAYILALAPIAWGLRMLRHRSLVHPALRVVFLLTTLLFGSAAMAGVPAFALWPLEQSHMGGFAGAMVLAGLQAIRIGDAGLSSFAATSISICLATGAGVLTLGFTLGEWQRLGRRIGWLFGWAGYVTSPKKRSGTKPARAVMIGVLTRKPAIRKTKSDAVKTRVAPKVSSRKKTLAPSKRAVMAREPELRLAIIESDHELPPLDLLHVPPVGQAHTLGEVALARNADILTGVLYDFGIRGEIVKIRPGPVVTLYELEPAPGTKSSRVINLADDIARSMSAVSVRVAVVAGRNVIGIELPNARREIVHLRELIGSDDYERSTAKLMLALGKDIGGGPVLVDLARMPHLLVAGTTGSGKSVAINTMIMSLVYRLPPERCRLIMIDPKMLELSVYDGIPHLLAPVVTEPGKAVVALKWIVREMENRYRAMSKLGVRNIESYNTRLHHAREAGEVLMRKVQTGFDPDTGKPVVEDQPIDLTELPYIVVVVDEFADLMLVAGKEIEAAIQRLAQMARAAGIHLIMATQRPSVDVITGTIKANFPTRISFAVTSKIDSRTILGEGGAEQLLGHGDMLYMASGGRIIRVHGPFVSDDEVESVAAHLKEQGEPDYVDSVTEDEDEGGFGDIDGMGGDSGDELYDRAVALVARERKASTSFIQRHLQIGYNRAARIVEQMEKEGVIGQANHVGRREVLI
ncbi:MAG: DNA translocase FtsK 4TM domain-containing protein [Pseudomonadota bacterium]|nr:DNA translocase FtsK 4TM domain-containing protein [Pseudomonadota bacterium]